MLSKGMMAHAVSHVEHTAKVAKGSMGKSHVVVTHAARCTHGAP